MDGEHEKMMQEMSDNFRMVLDSSPDGVYLWLDDDHKICNGKMAEMFGLTVHEWEKDPDFLDNFVAEKDREKFAKNYQNHVEEITRPISFEFSAIRKDGTTFLAETDMIPISWAGHAVAYHFVRKAVE